VVTRDYSEEATMSTLRDLAAIEAFRQQTASATRSYLERATGAKLNTPPRMISDPGHTSAPAGGCDRAVVTHIFNHQGQVLAMCRGMGNRTTRSIWIIRSIDARRGQRGAGRRPRGQPRCASDNRAAGRTAHGSFVCSVLNVTAGRLTG
jgi:hypothetical protein